MIEQEMRRKIGKLKIHFFSPKYEIICEFLGNNNIKQGKLIEIKADHINKKFILTFTEI